MRQKIYISLAWSCIALGVIGIFLPLLPTTPFLLAAALLFGKSSPRFYCWLTSNEYLNSYIENYRSRCGVPRKIIWRGLIFLWIALIASSFLWDNIYYYLLLLIVGGGVSCHLLWMKRLPREPRRFTLTELLVSMGVIALLASLLVPALARARNIALTASCSSNLRQIGMGLDLYSGDFGGFIPDTFNGYWGSSVPIIKVRGGAIFGLGKLVERYSVFPSMFGCPFNISRLPADVERAWNAGGVVQTAYIYRETDVGFFPKKSSSGNTGKAIVTDFSCVQVSGDPIVPHNYESVNILYNDGHVETRRNSGKVEEFFTMSTLSATSNMKVPPCDFIWKNADRRQ